MLLGLLALNGLYYLLPQFLQLVSGVDPLRAGLWMLPLAVITVGGLLLTPRLVRRPGRTRLLAPAGVLSVVGCLALTGVGPEVTSPVLVGPLAATILGVVPTGVLGADLVLGSVPPERAGSASTVSETAGELGGRGPKAVPVGVVGALVVTECALADLPVTPGGEAAGRQAVRGQGKHDEPTPQGRFPEGRHEVGGLRDRGAEATLGM